MIDIGSLSRASGIQQRRLRYVLDHNLLPGIELETADARGTRVMCDFDAFAVLLAARMLASGCPKGLVRVTVGSLYSAVPELGNLSLRVLWVRKARVLRLGDMRTVFLRGRWYTFDGRLMLAPYTPAVELRFSLVGLRAIIRRATV